MTLYRAEVRLLDGRLSFIEVRAVSEEDARKRIAAGRLGMIERIVERPVYARPPADMTAA